MRTVVQSLVLLAWLPTGLVAQSLEQRVTRIDQGTVRLSYPARAGVCGDGIHTYTVNRGNEEWDAQRGQQLVRAALEVQNHRVTGVRAYVGGQWRQNTSAVDLGSVRPQEAAAYFLSLAERDGNLAGDPIVAAVPALIRIARSNLDPEVRKSALFWLGRSEDPRALTLFEEILR